MIGHHNVGPTGVSGSASALHDQKACSSPPTGGETGTQFCDKDKQKARKLRVCLPAHVYARYGALLPSKRSRAIAAALGAIDAGIDLHRLIDAAADLRRLGILLNQALRLAHQDRVPLDYVERIEAVIRAVEALKP